ncbi:MAG TPA: hypothetical protein ENN22_01415 [bacterium]|nr:hypothetical protein [bacterium]
MRTLVNQNQNEGIHNAQWNGKDDSGNQLASGLYFCQLKTGHLAYTIKLLLIR